MVQDNRSETDGSNIDGAGIGKAYVPEGDRGEKEQVSFTLVPVGASLGPRNVPVFVPSFYPETIRVRRQRELDRQRGYCGGEDVSDTGAKNSDVHIQGKMLGDVEKSQLYSIAGLGDPLEMVATAWSGEVYIKEVEVEGPTGWHPPRSEFIYDYTLDLVSSGQDDPGYNSHYDPNEDNADDILQGIEAIQPDEDDEGLGDSDATL
jgi:hypothetical protein